MATLPNTFLQRKSQVLGTKVNTGAVSTNSNLPASFLQRKQQILTTKPPAVGTITPVAQPTATPTSTPNFLQKAGTAIGNIFKPEQKVPAIDVSNIKLQEGQKIPNLDLTSPVAETSAQRSSDEEIFLSKARKWLNKEIGNIRIVKTAYAPAMETVTQEVITDKGKKEIVENKTIEQLSKEYMQTPAYARNRKANIFLGGMVTGLTGGILKPESFAPENVSEKVYKAVGEVAGTVTTLNYIGKFFDSVAAGSTTIGSFINKYPKLSKFVVPLAKNVLTFDLYGQLDPDTKDRFQKIAIDTITAVPYTLLGTIGKARYSVPASFGLGFGLAKLSGSSNEDAFISGSILAVLDGVTRLSKGGNINKQVSDKVLKNESIDTLNKYAGTNLKFNASQAEIKKAYLKASLLNHPDRPGGSNEIMSAINVAYSILTGKGTFTNVPQTKAPAETKPVTGKELAVTSNVPATVLPPTEPKPPIVAQAPPVVEKAIVPENKVIAEDIKNWLSFVKKPSPETVKFLETTRPGVEELPFNKDGNITLYREGEVKPGEIQSYSLTKKVGQVPVEVNKSEVLVNFSSPAVDEIYKQGFAGNELAINTESLNKFRDLEAEVLVKKAEPITKIAVVESTPKELTESGVVSEMKDFVEDGGSLIKYQGQNAGWIQIDSNGVLQAIEIKPEFRNKGIAKEVIKQEFGNNDFKAFNLTESGKKLLEVIGTVTIDKDGFATISQKPVKETAVKAEFKVGDVLDPQGNTNMVGKVTLREIVGNTLKFIDSKGTEFSGMQRSIVRDLIKGGSWKKIEPSQPSKEEITLTIAPSKATTPEEIEAEALQAGTLQGATRQSLTSPRKTVYVRPAIGKTEFKTLLADPEFNANPVMMVNEDKNLIFKGEKIQFTIKPEALKVNPDRLEVGSKIRVDVQALKKAPGIEQTRIYKNGRVQASMNDFANLQNLSNTTEYKLIELPEMVRLATELMEGGIPSVAKPRERKVLGGRPAGLFVASGKGTIILNPDIFKKEGHPAKVLAHEMGHLADYLPDYVTSRGNLIGRIATLNTFLRQTFSGHLQEKEVDKLIKERNRLRKERSNLKDEEGNILDKTLYNDLGTELKDVNKKITDIRKNVQIANPEVKKELESLSIKWKPLTVQELVADPETGLPKMENRVVTPEEMKKTDPEYLKYRFSPPELYADAVSVLFNDPQMLKVDAPKFFDAFFKYLDQKPALKQEYLDLQTLLYAGDDEVMARRLGDLEKDYKTGEDTWIAKEIEKGNNKFNLVRVLDEMFNDVNAPMNRRVNAIIKSGNVVDPKFNPVFDLSGLNYLDGKIKNFIVDEFQPAVLKASEVPNGWSELGKILQLERAIYERGELANPRGYDPKTAQKTLDFMEKKFSPGDWQKLQTAKGIFRKATQALINRAEIAGYYRPELIEQMKANPAYATFQVLDYLDTYVSAKVYQQKGTLKGIANPATSSVMKAVSTLRAIEYNDSKKLNLDFLEQNYPDEIEPARSRFTGKRLEYLPSREPDKTLVLVVRDGKLKGYYVDKELDTIFNHTSNKDLRSLGKLSKYLTGSALYRPLFTTINLGFQLFNLKKDFDRAWRNMPDRTLGQALLSYPKLVKDYISVSPNVWKSLTGKPDAMITEMENQKLLGLTHNDLYGSPDPEEEQITRVLRKIGALPEAERKGVLSKKLIKPIVKLFEGVELVGNYIERLPKAAAYKRLKGTMSPEELAYYIRNYIGSPDFRVSGKATPITNNVFLFSNAAKEGIKGDINMARRPKTRGAWWFKTLLGTVMPKLLQIAIALGLLGSFFKKMMDNVSEYDKTNYTIIPLGFDKNGKTRYIRIPTDETGRFIGALVWKVGNMFKGGEKQKFITGLMDIFSLYSGQLPSLTPSWTGATALISYLSGQNPYDSFRNRFVIPDQEFKAGFKYSFPIMLDWLSKNQGLNIVLPSYTPDGNISTLEKILNLPVLSNILGRFVKVSDYGRIEQSKEIQQQIEMEAAQKNLEKRTKIDDAVKNFLKSEDQSTKARMEASGDLVQAVLGKIPETKEEQADAKAIDKKFRIGIVAGSYGTDVENVIDSLSNQAKAENLKVLYDSVEIDKFNELMQMMRSEGIVTTDTEKKFQQILMKKEQSSNIFGVKTAYAAENEVAFAGTPYQEKAYEKLKEWTPGEASYYNPTNPKETREGATGVGAYGRRVESGSAAFGNRIFQDQLKKGEEIYIQVKGFEKIKTPYGNGIFRIDDTMNPRYNLKGKFNIDFNSKDLPAEMKNKGRFKIEFKIIEPNQEKNINKYSKPYYA